MRSRSLRLILASAFLVTAGAVLTSCSTDSPTAPATGGQTPGSGTGGGTWRITITATPDVIDLTEEDTSSIAIEVRNASTGNLAPSGTTISVVTNGNLGTLSESSPSLINGRTTVVFQATGAEGTAVVEARLESSVARLDLGIIRPDDAAVRITSIEPSFGTPEGGDTVVIRGEGFEAPVEVSFGGLFAVVKSHTNERITVESPVFGGAPPSTVPVSVTSDLGTATIPNGFTFTFADTPLEPVILSFTPTTGPVEGGTEVVLNGSGFEPPVQVIFVVDGVEVEAEVLTATTSRIRVLTPDIRPFTNVGEAPFSSAIRVVNLDSGLFFQTSTSSPETTFFFGNVVRITAIGPSQGPADGGQLVTIFGQGFEDPVAVSLAGVGQQIVSVSGTEIVVRTVPVEIDGCGDVSGPTEVVNIGSGAGATGPEYTYQVLSPLITGVFPSSGDEDGGFTVTITGSGFVDPVRVRFGNQAASGVSVSGTTSITVTAPPAGALNEVACGTDGSGTQSINTAVDISVENLVSGCSDTFTGGFVYIPDDTTCRGEVFQCNDGVDNDGDMLIDFPADPGCDAPTDNVEGDA